MSQASFGEKVKGYLKAAGYSQKILASELGFDRTALSHKLNATGRTVLTHPEIKAMVKALAELGAITTQKEVLELLAEVNCPNFSQEEWQTKPLKQLDKAAPLTSPVSKKPGSVNSETIAAKIGSFAPIDTLTFLFSDIEGSTVLWEQQPHKMKLALARHNHLLRQAIEAHGGRIFKTVGDGFYAAFFTATQALQAAVASQRALKAEDWDKALGELRVRIGLHTGVAEEQDGDYFGPPLNRTARLLSAGHGGQILLSLACAELVRDHLPVGTSLRELGEYRLKDLTRPEHIFQLVAPDLPTQFPPLKTLETFQHNLPVQLTSFVGREAEISEVKRLLVSTHLLTLTGAGGAGKTRLSLQVAAELLESFENGVWFVELAPLSDPLFVPQTLAATLKVQEQPNRPIVDTLIDYLGHKRLLLILDNCEHLVQAVAQLAGSLLKACPHLRILASSREVLGIGGETTFRVPSLTIPDPKAVATIGSLSQYEAVRLFIDRALAVQPAFKVSNHNAPALAQICQRLDGIPLAIELAAARVKVLTLEQLASRLDDRFRLLTGGSRTALPRQQTLRATIDWSYNLLSTREQALLQRLSVFVGGCTLEAAEAVCAGDGVAEDEVLDWLTQLVNKSLVLTEEQEEGERYRLLETIRQYAQEKLKASGTEALVREKHGRYFTALVQAINPKLRGKEQVLWLLRLEAEHDNLREAFNWTYSEDAARIQMGLELAGALYSFWNIKSNYREGSQRLQKLILLARTAGYGHTIGYARLLNSASLLAHGLGNLAEALEFAREGERVGRELEDKPTLIEALNQVGLTLHQQGHNRLAESKFREGLALAREFDDRTGIARSLHGLGRVASNEWDWTAAMGFYEESLRLRLELGEKRDIAASLGNMGVLALYQGNYDLAQPLIEESLALRQEIGNLEGIGGQTGNLGLVALLRKDYSTAQTLLQKSIHILGEINQRMYVAAFLTGLAGVAVGIAQLDGSREHFRSAARLCGIVAALLKETSAVLDPPLEQVIYDRSVEASQANLGPEEFNSIFAEGQAMSFKQAVEYGLSLELTAQSAAPVESAAIPAVTTPSPSTGESESLEKLTSRELEVLRLVAAGLTDPQIAEQLTLSPRTVHAHLRTIYSKIGLTTRSAATRYAIENKLV